MSTETGRDTAWLHEAERSDLVRPKPTGRPHVLAIVLDDTGFGHLGCFGSTISTPNIDRLAAEGLRYSRFHVTAMCSPTRAAFFTGRNAHHGYPPRSPGLHRSHPSLRRHIGAPASRCRVGDTGHRQVAPRPSLRTLRCRSVHQLASRSRVRALLRVPPGRHEPVPAKSRRGQPLHRARSGQT